MDEITRLATALNAQRTIETIVGHLGTTEEEGLEKFKAMLAGATLKCVKMQTSKDALDAFKAEIGEDNFKVLAGTKTFDTMFEEFSTRTAKANLKVVVDHIESQLPQGLVSRDDIQAMIVLGVTA